MKLTILIALLTLTSCSTLKCMSPSQSFFGIEGKAKISQVEIPEEVKVLRQAARESIVWA